MNNVWFQITFIANSSNYKAGFYKREKFSQNLWDEDINIQVKFIRRYKYSSIVYY